MFALLCMYSSFRKGETLDARSDPPYGEREENDGPVGSEHSSALPRLYVYHVTRGGECTESQRQQPLKS